MLIFLLRRLLHGVAVLWVVATLTFVLLRLAPGGPFDSERRLPPEVLANIQTKYHLDEPLLGQYLRYLTGVLHADFGPSYKYLDRGVNEIIVDTLPTSGTSRPPRPALGAYVLFSHWLDRSSFSQLLD